MKYLIKENFDLKKYFTVSTDKATNPVNMMGASKRIMEKFIFSLSKNIKVSTARFANVAFSDGSLFHSFDQRLKKKQPISAPNDIKRYFVIPREAGELCILSTLLGENRDIFFPKLSEELHLITFSEIAKKYLKAKGYEPYLCQTEDEARAKTEILIKDNKWPCYFFNSDTTGEKSFEEFYTDNQIIEWDRFNNLGIIKNEYKYYEKIDKFINKINEIKDKRNFKKKDLVELFEFVVPEFNHIEKNKNLDQRM